MIKQSIASIYTQNGKSEDLKEITDLLEKEGYEIIWNTYPINATIVKETEEVIE